jgi:pimeloyl-ACP methyl ester carboxylesterase
MRIFSQLLLFFCAGFVATLNDCSATDALTMSDLRLGEGFTQHLIPIPGGHLSCYRRSGSGPSVLLIPGTFSDARIYAPLTQRLDSSLDLLILESRGLGGSWQPPEQSSIEQCAADATLVMNALQVDQFYVGGHSLGGMIAIELGRQLPDRVRGIVSIEGWTNAKAAVTAFQSDMKSTQTPQQSSVLAEYRRDVLQKWSPEQIRMFGSIWRKWDGSNILLTTTLPVLELYGDRSRPRPDRSLLGLPERDSIQLKWFAGASHSLLIERPEGVAVAINQFVAAHSEIDSEAATSQSSTADVVVLGGTPGGIAAALATARSGRSVVLIESHNHLGGMMASGLGKSDIEHKEKIGGIFLEFTRRVLNHYVATYGQNHENVKLCQDGYYYEPSVAEDVLDAMLAEQLRITVLRGWRLTDATTQNQKLVSVDIADQNSDATKVVFGQVFLDATYEGDLYAAAGAGFRIGRESRDEFHEPHAGIVYFDYQRHQFLPGTTGAGDDRLPAYTYRLCLTTDPGNSVPLTSAPAGYDRNHYLGYFDDLNAGRLAGPKTFKPGRGYNPAHFNTLVRALSVTPLPNQKNDVNINPRPLGFPFVEMNHGYLEADQPTRQAIIAKHREVTLGLLWFLQNDEEIPEAHRLLARELHLPKDEFLDTNHFPFQLYVREGRRLKGVYTLNENDITGTGNDRMPHHHADSIAVGEFPIDSFPCRKRQPEDTIVLEGYLGMLDYITRPYEIPYRIMIPEQVDGLIVPVAASTTHVAYSSIRMEPTWMALGQAAGIAADLAIRHNVSPRSVPIDTLQETLIKQGQVIRHQKPFTAAPMLAGNWVPEDPRTIDFENLPRIPSELVIVSDVSAEGHDPSKVDKQKGGVNQHNYLIHHQGQFLIMWSDGPGVEDRVGQRVKFATSQDGQNWSNPEFLTPEPPGSGPGSEFYGTRTEKGFRWIARGFWKRDRELLALASLDEAAGFFGPGLTLRAFRLQATGNTWEDVGIIADNTINNFPPDRLPNGLWMMSRRTYDYKKTGVHFLIGGVESMSTWESFPVLGSGSELAAEEPLWWTLPDNRLLGLFRDNRHSGFIFRSFSSDQGRTWTLPERTNFPDATSKLHGLRIRDGRYVLVSNANPKKRDPLVLSISSDGVTFQQMGYLVDGRHVDYPHVMEHDGHLFVAFAGGKQSVEVLRINIDEMTGIMNKVQPFAE